MIRKNIQFKTFEKKLKNSDFKFHYAIFKNSGWTGRIDSREGLKKDIKELKARNETQGLVRISFYEKSDLNRKKKLSEIAEHEKQEQLRLKRLFKFNFGYSIKVPNGLTINIYKYAIDNINNIVRTDFANGACFTYCKKTKQEIKEHRDKWEAIK